MKRFTLTVAVLLLIGFTSTAMAQRTGRGNFFGGGGPASLLMLEEVRKELNITSEQQEKLQALRGDRGDFENLSREERQKRFEELAKKTEETIKTVLDEKQRQRLAELQIQREGASAIARAEVADKLGLDQAQKDQIRKIQEENRGGNNLAGFQDATQEERQKLLTEFRERREKQNAALLAVLTPAQKETFEKMQGAKFTFPERRRGNQ